MYDRGAETLKLQDFLIDLINKNEVILIRGNHEDLLCELVDNIYMWMNERVRFSHHGINGTLNTLLDLAQMSLDEAIISPEKVLKRVENTPTFKVIMPAMRDFYETEKYVYVHGWLPCSITEIYGRIYNYFYDRDWRDASSGRWKKARWLNGIEAWRYGVKEPSKTIVCGHFHTSFGHYRYEGVGSEFGPDADFSPFVAEGIIAVDACTSRSGIINCVVIDD